MLTLLSLALANPAEPLLVRVDYADRAELVALTAEVAPWEVHDDWLVTLMTPAQIEELRATGFVITEMQPPAPPPAPPSDEPEAEAEDEGLDIGRAISNAISKTAPKKKTKTEAQGIPGFPCYPTVEETLLQGAALAASHPTLASWIDIGDSWARTSDPEAGFDLMELRITNASVPGPKPVVFSMSGLHAREYAPVAVNLALATHLLEQYGTDPDATWLVDHRDIHVLLHANPDGRKQAEQQVLWRKNANNGFCEGSTYRGVDLNRNFDFEWQCCGGSSDNACSEVFRGEQAGSEPETIAIQNRLRELFADRRPADIDTPAPPDTTGVMFDLHAYSELVLWPWGRAAEPPNAAELTTLGRRLAFFTDYKPEQLADLYPTDGTAIDFAYGELGVASYTIEIGTTFFQACDDLDALVAGNLEALLYAARVADAPYTSPSGPDVFDVTVGPDAVRRKHAVELVAHASDERFGQRNGAEPVQAIAEAVYSFDLPPGHPDAKTFAMQPVDGTLDTPDELVTATFTPREAGLRRGRHLVYVRARDADGAWGPVRARFLTVGEL